MHEVGIAQEILTLAFKSADKAKSITRLGLTVGNRSGIDRSSLEFALSALREGTIAADCAFDIVEVKTRGFCTDCGKESCTDPFFAVCPHCGSAILEYSGGEELTLNYVDFE
ncbi:MAG: hydrogenase maturation nickel metallochaperone HypA [Deferribacteraceae bacterium]|jgi:hydrogenase nickel incorporation protein HypA/HybF|nr:hydrogenase maturation nickel metallochaperone HypA [Deferribacteraceae bacterium]